MKSGYMYCTAHSGLTRLPPCRSSKERSLFPKQDMLKERAERENWATDSTESNSIRLEGEGEKAGKKNPDGIVVKVIENYQYVWRPLVCLWGICRALTRLL